MNALIERRQPVADSVSAAVVIGLEPGFGGVSLAALQAVSERLERGVRPWDVVVPLGPGVIGILCTSLCSPREVEGVAARLVDAVRAPIAVDDEIYQLGACHGSSVTTKDEDPQVAFERAQEAMRQMRATRALILDDSRPAPSDPA